MSRKAQEVEFYLDRSKESALRIINSILGNPTVTGAEEIVLLRKIASQHAWIATVLGSKIDSALRNSDAIEEPNRSQSSALPIERHVS